MHTGAPSTSRVQRIRRWSFAVLTADFLLLAAIGGWLTFRYEPGGGGLSGVHGVLGVVAVVAALLAAIATVADAERSTAAVVPAVVVLALVAGIYLLGPTLAWDGLVVNGDVGEARGVTVVFDEHVGAVQRGGEQLTVGEYRRFAWLHVVALPIAVVAMGAAGVWARRRSRYVPRRAAG